MIAIWGKYKGKIEKLDTAKNQREANFLVQEYRMAFGSVWKIWAGLRREGPRNG